MKRVAIRPLLLSWAAVHPAQLHVQLARLSTVLVFAVLTGCTHEATGVGQPDGGGGRGGASGIGGSTGRGGGGGVAGRGDSGGSGDAGSQGGASAGSGGVGNGAGASGSGAGASGGGAGASGSGAGVSGSSGGGSAGSGGSMSVPGLGTCLLPSGATFAHAQAAYDKWATDLLTSDGARGFLRVRRPNSQGAINTTNSEGISYGMLIAVYLDKQDVFDRLWKYEQLFLDANGLMNWEINPEGTGPTGQGQGAATDGDEDMAFALIMANKKWGGRGTLSDTYLNYAKRQIDLIWRFEVDHSRGDVLMPGDQFGGAQVINISYFAPAFYRVFGEVTGKTADWNRVVESSYRVLEATLNTTNGNRDNGLVPAWSTPEGVPMAPAGTSHPTYHQLDSCRTPFRIAQDACWFDEPRAVNYLRKINTFYSNVGARNIIDGYDLNGTPRSGSGMNLVLAAFVGPAGVGAMVAPEYATLRNEAYAAVASLTLLGGSLYYNESWTVLSLLMMNGAYLK